MSNLLSSVKVVLGLETKGFQAGTAQIKNLTESAKKSLGNLKTAIAGYFTIGFARELSHQVSQMAERWKNVSEQTGLSTDEVQAYDFYLKKVGSSIEDLQGAFDVLGKKREDALENGGEALRGFQRMGISVADLQSGKSNAQMLFGMNPDDRTGLAGLFGGKRVGKISASIRSVQEGGEVPTASKEDIKILDDAAKAFERASLEFKIAAIPLVAAITNFGISVTKWLGEKDENGYTRMEKIASPFTVWQKQKEIGEEIGYTAQVDSENLAMERRLGIAKRKGINSRDVDGPQNYDQAVAATSLVGGGPQRATGYARGPSEIEATRKTMQDAAFNMVFKGGNDSQQKKMLDKQIAQKIKDAASEEGLGHFGTADKLRSEAMGLTATRADMDKQAGTGFKADAIASVGGFIGGAAAGIDPSLTVAQDTLNVQRQILIQAGATVEMLKAIRDAANGNPIGR